MPNENKSNDRLLAERDLIGTQLVKRNNLLAIQESKIKHLQHSLDIKERECNESLEAIKLLKLEIQRMRHEKTLLTKGVNNMIDLRHEVFNLEREIKNERIRSRALEELINTPQNIHRWRKLEDIDSSTVELLEQVNILQKKNLEKTQKIMDLEARISKKKNEKNENVNTDAGEIYKLKRILGAKEEKIKALIAELKLRESQLAEYKRHKQLNLETTRSSSSEHREKKREERIRCESAPINSKTYLNVMKIDPKKSPKKFLGGGFNLTPKQG